MADRGAMVSNRIAARRRPAFGRAGPVLVVSLLILCGGWSVLWLVARTQANRAFDSWLVMERAQGREWRCRQRSVGGYPLSIVLRCDGPTFADAGPGGTLHGHLERLKAEAPLYFPTNVAVTLNGPLTLEDTSVGLAVQATWSDLHVTLRGAVPGDLDRGELDATDLVVVPRPGGAPTRIGRLLVGMRPIARGTDDRIDLDARLRVADVSSPEADALIGATEPIAASATLSLSRLGQEGANVPAFLESWRRAGGQVTVGGFEISKGSFRVAGDGRLDLDEEHRLEGRLTARFSGLEPLAARFGLPLGTVKIGSALANLLGGAARPGAPAELSLPLVLRDGRLAVGPFKTGIALTPLY